MTKIQGVPLDRAQNPPWLVLGGAQVQYVVMEVRYQPVFGTVAYFSAAVMHLQKMVWESGADHAPSLALLTQVPANVPSIIDYGAGTGTAARRYLVIATITNGQIDQKWWGELHFVGTDTGGLMPHLGG